MRMIDADTLGLSNMEIVMCNGDYKEALKMLIDKIEHAPTIKERKTGSWLFIDDEVFAGYHICSNCRERAVVNLYGEEVLSNFCPNCGADMSESNKLLNNCSKCKYGKNYLNNMWWCEKHDMMKNREGESCSDFKNR